MRKGLGVTKGRNKAQFWFQQEIKHGAPDANVNLGSWDNAG